VALARGAQRGRADVDMTATAHRGGCPACGQAIEAEIEWLQDGYRTWQPLANADVTGGQPVHVDDLVERVNER